MRAVDRIATRRRLGIITFMLIGMPTMPGSSGMSNRPDAIASSIVMWLTSARIVNGTLPPPMDIENLPGGP